MVFGERLRALSGSTPRRPPSTDNYTANPVSYSISRQLILILVMNKIAYPLYLCYSDCQEDTTSSFFKIFLFIINNTPHISHAEEAIYCKAIITAER